METNVWIPCTGDGANGSIKYDRYAFTRTCWYSNQIKTGDTIAREKYSGSYTEKPDSVEQTSVSKYGGFYIGRYEAGIERARTTRGDQTKMTMEDLGIVLEKKGPSYTYVTRDQAKSLAEEISSHYGYKATSKLCSSYAWDTALTFIDQTNPGYSTNSTQGNYSSGLKSTGDTSSSTAVCNIYDMGGNVSEWTTEECSIDEYPYVDRGGVYFTIVSDTPAAYREYTWIDSSCEHLGFRPTLYL